MASTSEVHGSGAINSPLSVLTGVSGCREGGRGDGFGRGGKCVVVVIGNKFGRRGAGARPRPIFNRSF